MSNTVVELLAIAGMGLVNSVASSCCNNITKKKINVNIEKELKKKKYGENPTDEQLDKAAKAAARKCITKRYLIYAAVSSVTLVGTTVLASTIVNNASANTTANENTSDNASDTSADSTTATDATDSSDVSNVA